MFYVAVTKYASSAFSLQTNICTEEEQSPRDALLFMEITYLTLATSVDCTMHINACAAHPRLVNSKTSTNLPCSQYWRH